MRVFHTLIRVFVAYRMFDKYPICLWCRAEETKRIQLLLSPLWILMHFVRRCPDFKFAHCRSQYRVPLETCKGGAVEKNETVFLEEVETYPASIVLIAKLLLSYLHIFIIWQSAILRAPTRTSRNYALFSHDFFCLETNIYSKSVTIEFLAHNKRLTNTSTAGDAKQTLCHFGRHVCYVCMHFGM